MVYSSRRNVCKRNVCRRSVVDEMSVDELLRNRRLDHPLLSPAIIVLSQTAQNKYSNCSCDLQGYFHTTAHQRAGVTFVSTTTMNISTPRVSYIQGPCYW